MPYGDEKHNVVYEALASAIGKENVADGPATMRAYSRDMFAVSVLRRKRGPEFVALPANTEEVRQIVLLANRYKFPYSVMSTGWMFPMIPDCIFPSHDHNPNGTPGYYQGCF